MHRLERLLHNFLFSKKALYIKACARHTKVEVIKGRQ